MKNALITGSPARTALILPSFFLKRAIMFMVLCAAKVSLIMAMSNTSKIKFILSMQI